MFQKSCFWKINIAQIINDKGFLSLKESYETCSPGLVYSSWKAKTKLYQIPIATVGIGDLKKGNYQVFVCSKDSNLSLIKNLLTMKLRSETKMKSLDTHSVKAILDLAESEAERKRLKFMAVKSSGLTIHAASKQFGFRYSYEDNAKVEEAIDKFQEIKDSVLSIAATENEAFMKIMGFDCDSASSSSSSEDDDNEPSMEKTDVSKNLDESTGDHDKESSLEKRDASKNLDESTATDHGTIIPHQFLYKEEVHNTPYINSHQLMDLLQVCELNWFQFAFVIEDQLSPITPEALAQLLLDFSGQIPFMRLTNEIESKIEYSRQAHLQQTRRRKHEEWAELGLIVSDNSSEEEQSN